MQYHVLGVMSGTSMDGIDLAEITFTLSEKKTWSFEVTASETIAYPLHWEEKLRNAVSFSEVELQSLNIAYTDYLSEVIIKFIQENSIKNLDAVCSHGHTVLHQPENGMTLQIGNLPKISNNIQQKVVCDFRTQDVELGGQGAPLVPIGDRLLFNDYNYCLNLGGFANVSMEKEGERIAYDICAVNVVLNKYARQLGLEYDDKGQIAKGGTFSLSVSASLKALPFYKSLPPKSLGMEWVDKEIFPILEAIDIEAKLRTYTDHIAEQIARQFNQGTSVLVTGGGAYNDYLLKKVRDHKDVNLVVPAPELIEFKEAIIFGLLGVLRLRDEVNCLASVTGAKEDHSSGEIYNWEDIIP